MISQYEFITDEVSNRVDGNLNNLLKNLYQFKKQIDFESMYPDLDNLIRESLKTIEFMRKSVARSEIVSLVEYN